MKDKRCMGKCTDEDTKGAYWNKKIRRHTVIVQVQWPKVSESWNEPLPMSTLPRVLQGQWGYKCQHWDHSLLPPKKSPCSGGSKRNQRGLASHKSGITCRWGSQSCYGYQTWGTCCTTSLSHWCLARQPMILTDFYNSWVNWWGESLLCHGPANISWCWGFFWYSWASRCQPRAEAIFQSHFLQMFPDNFNLSRGSDIINPVWMEQVNSCHLDLVGHLCYLEWGDRITFIWT